MIDLSLSRIQNFYIARIVRVIDGDTFDFDIDHGMRIRSRQRIRLHGVDCPEMRGPTKHYGFVCKKFVENYFDKNKIVTIFTTKEDGFGRWVAKVWPPDGLEEDNSLSQKLIDEGWATEWSSNSSFVWEDVDLYPLP
jgi:micrococcal nuclease